MARITTFDDWIDYFRQWQSELGLDPAMFKDWAFETKFGDIGSRGDRPEAHQSVVLIGTGSFGVDNSSAASWFYVWGLKGRFDEDVAEHPADRNHLNEEARAFYAREVQDLVDALNNLIPEGQPRLYLPDAKFNRTLGEHRGHGTMSGANCCPPRPCKHTSKSSSTHLKISPRFAISLRRRTGLCRSGDNDREWAGIRDRRVLRGTCRWHAAC